MLNSSQYTASLRIHWGWVTQRAPSNRITFNNKGVYSKLAALNKFYRGCLNANVSLRVNCLPFEHIHIQEKRENKAQIVYRGYLNVLLYCQQEFQIGTNRFAFDITVKPKKKCYRLYFRGLKLSLLERRR